MVREAKKTEEQLVQKKSVDKKDYIHAVGRRREAIARVRLYSELKEELKWGEMVLEKGKIYVNQKPVEEYFSGVSDRVIYMAPFQATNTVGNFTITVRVVSGGKHGQLEALVQAISRALTVHNTSHRLPLKKKGFLTRDSRTRQRRKVGMGGKSRREKQSPKR